MKIKLPLSNFPYENKPKFVIQGKFYEISRNWLDTIFLFHSLGDAEAFISEQKNSVGGEYRVAINKSDGSDSKHFCRNSAMKLKVLPLPNWLVLGLKYNYDSDLHRVLGKKISPIFNKEGYYYDRLTKKCWIEINGFGTFEYNSYQFLDDLYYFSRSERRLNDLELQAIKTLAQSRLASKRQLELMRAEIQIRNLRNISVSSRLMVAKVLKNQS